MSRYTICLSLYGNLEEISAAISAHPEADVYEIRLDLSAPLLPAVLRRVTTSPIIFTAGDKPELMPDSPLEGTYLDVGNDSSVKGSQYIVSHHGAEEDPEKIWQKFSGNHITKIALETENYEIIQKLLSLNKRHKPNALCFAMGDVASFSRVLALFKGAPWIYAGLPGKPTAPGQFHIQELCEIYKLPRFETEPLVFGIVGDPVARSKSPAIQNQMFADNNLPWIYLPFLCKDLRPLLTHASQFGIAGLSITHPYKKDVIPFLDEYPEEVRRLQACNTICLKRGKWKGINTDMLGIRALLEQRGISIEGKRIMILGAGGAARTIAAVVGPHTGKLSILNRDPNRAQELASIYGGKAGSLDEFGRFRYDILFQATSVGMIDDESPVDPVFLRAGKTVVDVIYEPSETLLLQKARALGCRTINGEAWFQAQAAAQFKWWTSELLKPPKEHRDTETRKN